MKAKAKAIVLIASLVAAKQIGEVKGAYFMLRKIDKDGIDSVQGLIEKARHIEEGLKELKNSILKKPRKTEETPAEETQEEETVIDVTETTAEEAVEETAED